MFYECFMIFYNVLLCFTSVLQCFGSHVTISNHCFSSCWLLHRWLPITAMATANHCIGNCQSSHWWKLNESGLMLNSTLTGVSSNTVPGRPIWKFNSMNKVTWDSNSSSPYQYCGVIAIAQLWCGDCAVTNLVIVNCETSWNTHKISLNIMKHCKTSWTLIKHHETLFKILWTCQMVACGTQDTVVHCYIIKTYCIIKTYSTLKRTAPILFLLLYDFMQLCTEQLLYRIKL